MICDTDANNAVDTKKQTPARDSHMMSSLCSHVCFLLYVFHILSVSAVASAFSFFFMSFISCLSLHCLSGNCIFLKETIKLVILAMTGYCKNSGQIHAEDSRIDFASIKILLYEISTSKSHLLAALTNSLTSSVAFNLIFLDINIILSFISAKNRPFSALLFSCIFQTSGLFHLAVPHYVSCCSDLSS